MKKTKKFKKLAFYKNKFLIMSPLGIIPKGIIMSGANWEKMLVYKVGNCGIEEMFDVVAKPIDEAF